MNINEYALIISHENNKRKVVRLTEGKSERAIVSGNLVSLGLRQIACLKIVLVNNYR